VSAEIELSVVVPCFEEAGHLPNTLDTIRGEVAAAASSFEVLVVDDGSQDETWDAVVAAADKDGPGVVRGLRLSRRFGKELALCAGLERARGRAVVVMDGDLQHPPSLIPEMVRAWREEGFDVVEAVKEGEATHVRLRARLFYAVLNRLSGIRLARATDFKLLDRKVIEAWTTMRERHVFFRGMSAWLGFRRKELPFQVAERAGGSTSWSTRELLRLAFDGLTSFSTLPLHLITTMGLVFMGFALILGANALIQKFTGVALTGFTTVIVLQLMIGSMLMVGLGILGQYVSKIYDEVKGRPRYVVMDEAGDERPGTDGA